MFEAKVYNKGVLTLTTKWLVEWEVKKYVHDLQQDSDIEVVVSKIPDDDDDIFSIEEGKE